MKTAILLSLAAAALAAPTPESIKVTLPRRRLSTRADKAVDPHAYFRELQRTLQKYGKQDEIFPGLNDKLVARASNEPLTDQGDDELYYGNIAVGSQSFTVDFDTGSSDLFVPGPKCGKAQGCVGTTKYNDSGESEGNKTSITYGSGSVSGNNYFATVTVAGLTATHQNVVSLTTASGFSTSDSEGLMGLAFESIAASKQPSFFETLVSEGKVSNQEFAFYLGREASGTGKNSELTLGGVDSSKYTGSFTVVPLNSETYWQVPLDGVTVNGSAPLIDTTAGSAAIDTGTTIVIAPIAAAEEIYSKIPGAIPLPVDGVSPLIFAYPCDSYPDVSIIFSNTSFAIAAEDFNLGSLTSDFADFLGKDSLKDLLASVSGGYCLGAVAGDQIDGDSGASNFYVVGDTFLKNWYASFSFTNAGGKPAVSFAPSIDHLAG